MTALPTRRELARRVASFHRRYKRVAAWYFAACFAMAVVSATAAFLGFKAPFGAGISILVLSAMAIVIFGGAFLLDNRRATIAREERVLCPSCGKPLIHANGKLAMTTGRCAECGEHVVSDV